MTKRILSLAITICLATIGAWAADVVSVDKQTLWTFGDYAGQSTSVYNYSGSGVFLHSSQTASSYQDFSVDTDHVFYTGGTFSGTDVAWSATSVLATAKGVDNSLLSLGMVDAASPEGPSTSLAFNFAGGGTLHVVYGSASEHDGTFYIRQRNSEEATFTTVYEKSMEGTGYTGPLAMPKHQTTSSYSFTMAEAVISFDEACTVYLGGSQPYCIYAILFEPTTAVTFDFPQIYKNNTGYELTFGEEQLKLYYYKRTDDTSGQDSNGNFYTITSDPVNNLISWRETNVQIGADGLKPTKGDRPFAIHGLKANDVIRIEFSGEIYYARHSSRGSSLKGMTSGTFITSGSDYTVSERDLTYDYVIFYPTQATTISKISINQELPVDDETATVFYISPDGNDANRGTLKSSPFRTLKKAQERVPEDGIIHILPGTYQVTAAEYMDQTSSAAWNIVFNLNKNNVQYLGETDDEGKRPVFDFSTLEPVDNKRITGFYLTAQNIAIKNIETVGIKVAKTESNTQSENFRLNGAVNCTLYNIAAHHGQGVGFYVTGNSKGNLIENCDAYENIDVTNRYNSSTGRYAGENNDGFGCHVNADCTGNRFIRCRAWYNADDGFDFIKCYSVAVVEECIAYMNGWATYPDGILKRSGNGNGIKAGGYGKGAITLPDDGAPMHVVRNSIAAKNAAGGFYANHHLGGLQFESNRAYQNGTDFRMTNRSLESASTAIGNSDDESEDSSDAMNQPGYGHILTSNLSYGNVIEKVIADIDVSKCTVAGNSFKYSDGQWSNANHTDSDFASVDVTVLTKERDADGNLSDDVFNFLKLNETAETVETPVVKISTQTPAQVTYSVTYPADAELHYILPDSSEETVTTDGTVDGSYKTITIEVTVAGEMKLYAQKGNSVSSIVSIEVTMPEPISIENAKVTLIDDSRKDRKVYQVLFGMNQKLYYMRPGQDTEPRSQSFKTDFITNPMTITVNNNGPFVYWTQETIDGYTYESEHATIMVTSIAKRPTATLSSVQEGYSEYEIAFTDGTTLYYKIGDGEEKSVSEGNTTIIEVAKSGQLIAYCKNDYVESDILTTTVYAPTPAPLTEGYLDFAEITADQEVDVPVTLDMTAPQSVEGATLYMPSELTAATFEGRYAFGEFTRSNQIRIRTNRQLYFSTAQDLKMGIMNIQAGDIVYVEYTGTILMDDPTALTPITETADEVAENVLRSGVPYLVGRDGNLLLTLSTAETVVGITKMYAGAPIVLKPTITDRGKNIIRITAGKSLTGEAVTTCYTVDGSEPTMTNGTSGPYDSFDVELLSGGFVTVKAVSYTDDGNCSDVASLLVLIEDKVHGPSFTYEDLVGNSELVREVRVYNVQGHRVNNVYQGKLYIVEGKKVVFIKQNEWKR